MAKIIRQGKVVLILSGKYAGKKAVVVKANEDGSKGRTYGHALVVGIEAAPLAVNKSMSQKRIAKRSHIKPFVKVINFNHMMVTRYAVEGLDFKSMLSSLEDLKEPSKKKEMKKSIRKMLEERYASGQNRWFFQKLRF